MASKVLPRVSKEMKRRAGSSISPRQGKAGASSISATGKQPCRSASCAKVAKAQLTPAKVAALTATPVGEIRSL